MKSKLTRLERISAVVEDAIEKLLSHSEDGEDNIYIYRYHLWTDLLYTEIKKDRNVDTSKLLVSKFMENIITSRIVLLQRLDDIHLNYTGWKSGDSFHYNKKEKIIKELFGI